MNIFKLLNKSKFQSLYFTKINFFSTSEKTKLTKKEIKLKNSKSEKTDKPEKKVVKSMVNFNPSENIENNKDDKDNNVAATEELENEKISYASTYITLRIPELLDLFKLRDIFYNFIFVKQNSGKIFLNILDESKSSDKGVFYISL